MGGKATLLERVRRIRQRDGRYAPEAYSFLLEALDFTVRRLGKARRTGDERHVTGSDLAQGVLDCALDRFGLLAEAVLAGWGIRGTEDLGEIVFNMVEDGLMGKSGRDRREDFHGVFDLRGAIRHKFRMEGKWENASTSGS
ncbi:MAG: hypothetical protein HY608_01720 [Planctomycetes bacterium]|nr:hypothetical protein [Planctomycetota bacterium]